MKNKKPLHTLIRNMLLCSAGLVSIAQADTYTPPAGVPTPSFASNFVVVDDTGNANDSTGYGGVNYRYRVSSTQITVGDWVAFLNAVDPNNTLGFDPIAAGCGNPFCFATYSHSGSTWSVVAFSEDGMNMSASQTANLPIDWLSLNMVARYMNWLATGNINNGAFTFSGSSGNSTITSFDANYPGPRLPLEDELYKAMFWDTNNNSYNNYPTTNLSGGVPVISSVDSTGIHNSNVGGALIPGFSTPMHYGQVGQETGNPWGLFDVTGNRHETTLEPSATTTTILRGASAFDNTGADHSLSSFRNNLSASDRYVSVGYRVWMGVSADSGNLSVTKQVTGGSDPQTFSLQLDCSDNNFDTTFSLTDGQTYISDNIPINTQCSVTETTPTAPNGYSYGSPVIAPASVTIQKDQTIAVTVTNPLTTTTSCTINTPTVAAQCNDNGTASDGSDDIFSFNITTTGTDVSTDYNIQTGSDTFSNVPYNIESGPYGSYLITDGDISLTLTDGTDASCQLSNITVSPPAPCPVAPVCTTVTNTASITDTDQTDSNAANNSDSANLSVNCANNPQIDLQLIKTVDKNTAVAGDSLVYTLTLTNNGPDDGTGVEISDQLPTGLSYTSSVASQGSYDSNTGIWQVGDLANQAQATLTLTVTVD